MADFGAPVAQNVDVNPAKSLQTLSQLYTLKSQQQLLAGQAAEVQMTQQNARQRAGIAAFMQHFDPTQHVGADGTLDLDEVLTDPKLRQAAGDQFPELIGKLLDVKQQQLTTKQTLSTLNADVRTQFQQALGGLRTDPDVIKDGPEGRTKAQRAIGEFAATGPDAARIAQIYGNAIQHAPPGKLAQALSVMQQQAMAAGSQAATQAPNYLNAGAQAVNVNPQAAGGDVTGTPPVTMTIPPGRQPFTDPFGRVFNYNPQTGNYEPTNTGGAAPPGAAPKPAPGVVNPGDLDTVKTNVTEGAQRYHALVNASAGSPGRMNILDNIITLAPQTRTGPGSGWKAAAETFLGQTPGFKGAKDDAAKYNELKKFLHQNALQAWQSAGGTGTNQQLSTIEGANPNVAEHDPTTIVELAKFAKAGEMALQAKTAAHQTWMHQPGNNFANQADFEGQWREHFDPLLFQLKTWNAAEAKQHLKGLSQAQIDDLARKQAWLKEQGLY